MLTLCVCVCVASSGMNIPHRCNSTKHRIISPKLPCGPAPYLTEVQNLTHESSGGGATSRDGAVGDSVAGGVANEKTQPSSPVVALDNGSSAPPSSSSSSPPQTHCAASIALGNGNGFYGDQRGGLATVALPQNAVIVMTTAAAAAALGRGGEESKGELSSAHLSLTHTAGRLVLSPVPTKQETPPPSPAPVPTHTVSSNQGVATLSLTLLPSPVIGGLLLTDRIITDKPSAMLRPSSPSPSLMAPPFTQTGSVPSPSLSVPLHFDPDSFLNSPKQGQTYGGSSLSPLNTINSVSSSQSPPHSSSPQPPSLALTLSPTSPPSSLSSLSPPTSTPNSASLSPSLSYSLSPSCPTPSLPPLCLDSSLALDSLTHPLSPTLDAQVSSPQVDVTRQSSVSDGQALLIGQDENAPPTLLSLNYTHNQLLPSQHSISSHLSANQLPLSQLSPKQPHTNQLPSDRQGAGLRLQEEAHLMMTQTHTHTQGLRPPGRGLRHSLSQPALLINSDTHTDAHTHSHTHSHTHTLIAQVSPVQVKEEKSPPITQTILRELECDEMPMDTAHSSDSSAHQHTDGVELSFDSTFPDLISELVTEEANSHSACTGLNSSSALPTYPVRYMAPPQPTPSTSYLPYALLTQTHTHSNTHSGVGEEPQRLASITDFSPEWSYPEVIQLHILTHTYTHTCTGARSLSFHCHFLSIQFLAVFLSPMY